MRITAHEPTGLPYKVHSGTFYHPRTDDAVVDVLERCRASGETVRVFHGDPETGKTWPEEHDVVGRIGRSMGPVKVPLLVPLHDVGGPAMLEHCVVAIRTKQGFLYKHPKWDNGGTWTIVPSAIPGYVEAVCGPEGSVHARFKKKGQAARYRAFMQGGRLTR